MAATTTTPGPAGAGGGHRQIHHHHHPPTGPSAAAAALIQLPAAPAVVGVHRPYKEVVAGSIAAFVSTLVCHPIDVLRTELQTQREATSARACVERIVKADGARGFYKGLSAPLAAQAVYKAVIFGANSAAQSALSQRRKRQRPAPSASAAAAGASQSQQQQQQQQQSLLTYPDVFLCGGLAGAVNAFVVAPVELVRNRLVVLKGRYHGPVDCVRDILRHEGGLPGLWRGIVPTLWRDGPGVGAWFLAFAAGKDALLQRKLAAFHHNQQHHHQQQQQRGGPSFSAAAAGGGGAAAAAAPPTLGLLELLVAGSGAGVAFWTVALPFDTIKSVVQVSSAAGTGTGAGGVVRREGMVAVALRLVREEGGLRRLFRGWQGAFGRAVPGSAATLAVFDIVKDKL